MKTRIITALSLVALIATAFGAPTAALAKKKSGPLVVGTDPAGDWGDADSAPIGDALGMDLIEASIAMADKTTVNFVIKLNSLPPSGGVPEASRYTWDFLVDGEYTELDGKFTNFSRGACDPTAASCPPPRNPGLQPFALRGNCVANEANVTTCEEIGIVNATFDAAAATITIPVPLELMNAKLGSKIAPATNIFGGSISAAPSAFVSSTAAPFDFMTVLKTFSVPKK